MRLQRELACVLTNERRRARAFALSDPPLLVLVAALAVGGSQPIGISAQGSVGQLRSECAAGDQGLELLCADAALAVQALHSGVGLLMTAGGALPASPSTLGQRMAGSPRVAVDVGGSWASLSHPDLSRPGNPSGVPEKRSLMTGLRMTTVVGVFDGFSVVPGVDGLLGLDAVGLVQLMRMPESPAASSPKVAWGGGVRLGILRESFSLPGVTVTGIYRRAGELNFGTREGTGALATMSPSMTSVRVIVGKDLWPVGLSLGAGWDRYRGDGRIEARLAESGGSILEGAGSGDLSMNRKYFFTGANFTWLVTQLAAELGWARGASPLADLVGTGPFRAGGSALQGTLTFRFTY